jgi:hypothetical protein
MFDNADVADVDYKEPVPDNNMSSSDETAVTPQKRKHIVTSPHGGKI